MYVDSCWGHLASFCNKCSKSIQTIKKITTHRNFRQKYFWKQESLGMILKIKIYCHRIYKVCSKQLTSKINSYFYTNFFIKKKNIYLASCPIKKRKYLSHSQIQHWSNLYYKQKCLSIETSAKFQKEYKYLNWKWDIF